MSLILMMVASEPTKTTDGEQISLTAFADASETNKNWSWAKWTPSGNLSFHATNPAAFGQIVAGAGYYVTITPVPPAPEHGSPVESEIEPGAEKGRKAVEPGAHDPVKIGDCVVFNDAHGNNYNALITAVHGPIEAAGNYPSVNLVFVNNAPNMENDAFGAPMDRALSVVHRLMQGAPGMYWDFE